MQNKALEIQKMAAVGCTLQEIGQKLGMSHQNITKNYPEAYQQGRAEMIERLRLAQFKCAYENVGNCTMLIFLGKIYLNQREVAHEDKLSELDILLKHLNDRSQCSNYQKNSLEATETQMLE